MYLTIEDVKNSRIVSFEGLPDEFIKKRLENLSMVIDEYCNTKFTPTEATWSTDLKRKIVTLKKPLLHVNELEVLSSPLEENEDYYVYPEKNLIEFEDISKYERRKKALSIKYTYGYEEVPAIVKEVLLDLFKENVSGTSTTSKIKSEQWEDYSYTLADNTEITQDILARLDRFAEDDSDYVEGATNKIQAMLL